MVPDGERLPLQPSPAAPPEAEHESALLELHVSETLWPELTVVALAERLAVGVGAAADVPAGET
jgi:hypothetical protein